jgi:hypothetical protein
MQALWGEGRLAGQSVVLLPSSKTPEKPPWSAQVATAHAPHFPASGRYTQQAANWMQKRCKKIIGGAESKRSAGA